MDEGSHGRWMNHQKKPDSRRGRGSGMDVKRMTRQRREGETCGPRGQRPFGIIPKSRTEHVRLAHQAVVAIAGAGMINRPEPRACGCSRQLNGQSCKVIASE